MKKEICTTCEKDLNMTNPKYVLKELTGVGYVDEKFCTTKCFIKFIIKNFKRKIKELI